MKIIQQELFFMKTIIYNKNIFNKKLIINNNFIFLCSLNFKYIKINIMIKILIKYIYIYYFERSP